MVFAVALVRIADRGKILRNFSFCARTVDGSVHVGTVSTREDSQAISDGRIASGPPAERVPPRRIGGLHPPRGRPDHFIAEKEKGMAAEVFSKHSNR
jgi:hypothetical protein